MEYLSENLLAPLSTWEVRSPRENIAIKKEETADGVTISTSKFADCGKLLTKASPVEEFCYYEYKVTFTLENIEYLDTTHKELFSKFTISDANDKPIEKELTCALAYFVYRHCSEASDFEEFFLSLSLALVCTRLISSLSNKENIEEIARIVSEEIEYSEDNIEAIKNSFILGDEILN